MSDVNFWDKDLQDLSQSEWEMLCDGCGQCCMHKFEDEDTGEMLSTDIACCLFDADECACSDYAQRLLKVSDCLNIRNFKTEHYRWLPETCAYRLRFEKKPLFAWHPLLSGDAESVHQAGISMRRRCVSENDVPENAWLDHIQEVP
jgi:hypothetical protein